MKNLARLRSFIQDMTRLAERHGADEQRMLYEGDKLLCGLLAQDDWPADRFRGPLPRGLPAMPPALRPDGALLGGELRLDAGPEDADPRPHGVGPGRRDARRGNLRGVLE